MTYDVIVSGHLCADLLPETSHTPLSALSSPGRLFEIGALTIATGGAVSNTGLAFHRLGVRAGLMTTVGDDLLGQVIIAKLREREEYLGDLIKTRKNEASSYSVILSPENVDRIILHCAGNNEHFDIDDIDFDLVQQAKLFHLGYPTILPKLSDNEGESLMTIFQRVHEMSVITSLDMTLPDPNSPNGKVNWRQVLINTLPYCDIFIPSIEEISFMLRRTHYDAWDGDVMANLSQSYLEALANDLLEMGVAITGFKLGEYGFYLQTTDDDSKLNRLRKVDANPDDWRGLSLWYPAFKVDVVGTTGAGDSAYGGFLTALLRGSPPEECIRFACAVGACNVEAPDATSGVRSWAETQARLNSDWEQLDLVLAN